LQIDGALAGTSAVTVSNTATLKGSGRISGLITVLDGGTLAPGANVGVLTVSNGVALADGATLAFDLFDYAPGTGYDNLALAGGEFDAQGANVTLSLNLGWLNPANDATFTIVTGTLGASSHEFGTVSLQNAAAFTAASKSFRVDYHASDITLTVIPEPSTVGLIGLAAALLRRRRMPRATPG